MENNVFGCNDELFECSLILGDIYSGTAQTYLIHPGFRVVDVVWHEGLTIRSRTS